MPCYIIVRLILFLAFTANKFTVRKGRGMQVQFVEFEIGEEVQVYIQKEKKRLIGKVLRGPHKFSVYVQVPGRGEMWVHETNIFKIQKD